MTMIPLQNITLGSTASSVTFANIPTSVNGVALRDLYLVYNGTNSNSNAGLKVRLNGDTGSNYNRVVMANSGNSPVSSSQSNIADPDLFFGQTARTDGIANFFDYSVNDKHTTILARDGAGGADVRASALRWGNTAVVTSIQLLRTDGQTISIGSTFALWGIA